MAEFEPDESTAKAFIIEALDDFGAGLFDCSYFRYERDNEGKLDFAAVARAVGPMVVRNAFWNRRYDLELEDDRRRGDYERKENGRLYQDLWLGFAPPRR